MTETPPKASNTGNEPAPTLDEIMASLQSQNDDLTDDSKARFWDCLEGHFRALEAHKRPGFQAGSGSAQGTFYNDRSNCHDVAQALPETPADTSNMGRR